MTRKLRYFICFVVLAVFSCCQNKDEEYIWKSIEVTASAYNSVPSQTSNHPSLAAWGDTLKPGMKCIAVSRDLIPKGLGHNTQVIIEGWEGVFLVKDKMHYRWRNRIDIYMGKDVKRAKEWGKKKLTIQYSIKKDTTSSIEEKK